MATMLQHLRKTGEKEWTLDKRAYWLLYATSEQVQCYQELSREHHREERELLESAASSIVSTMPERFNIVALASGTSEAESIIVRKALLAGKHARYFAIDRSFEMLRASKIHIPAAADSYYVRADIFSTALPELRESTGCPNLVLFLGYTAFNFGKEKGLRYVSQNLREGDAAVITVGTIPPNIDTLVSDDYSHPLIQKWFLSTGTHAGFDSDAAEFVAVFDQKEQCMKIGLKLTADIKLGGLSFLQGDTVILSRSYKLPLEGKHGYLEFVGRYLKINESFTEPSGMTAVVLASAKT